MPIYGTRYQFTRANISTFAPARQGVYGLYDGSTIIYFGRASNSIRDRLSSHKEGYEGRCTQSASHFNWEETNRPIAREKELLNEYQREHGRLPRCNERVG